MQADGGSAKADDCFSDAALKMMAMMARVFGWRPDEFWRATPVEIASLLHHMAGAGLVGADLASAGLGGGGLLNGGSFGGGVARAELRQMMEAFPDE